MARTPEFFERQTRPTGKKPQTRPVTSGRDAKALEHYERLVIPRECASLLHRDQIGGRQPEAAAFHRAREWR
jgi:hypothetical protein